MSVHRYATAVNLFQNVVGFILLIVANILSNDGIRTLVTVR